MKIKRTIVGYDKGGNPFNVDVEIELTPEEICAAHEEHVTDFMRSVLESDFDIPADASVDLAEEAFDKYAEGEGFTEYECCEQVAANYEESKNL